MAGVISISDKHGHIFLDALGPQRRFGKISTHAEKVDHSRIFSYKHRGQFRVRYTHGVDREVRQLVTQCILVNIQGLQRLLGIGFQHNVRKAQETVDDYNTELSKLYDNVADLTIKAPHDGKLIDINADIKNGKDMAVGDAVATVVNDTKLRLHLYYSWAYEGQISVGQTAQITLPASMTAVTGTVEQVNYVKRVVSEGGVTFEVVFVLNNPGTLTEGMTASAALTTSDGTPIYPYESGKLEYYQTTTIATKAAGPVEQVADLMKEHSEHRAEPTARCWYSWATRTPAPASPPSRTACGKPRRAWTTP